MRHWDEEGASHLEQELLEILREDTPEPSNRDQDQVFAALSAQLGLGAAGGVSSAAASKAGANAVAGAKAGGTLAVAGTQAAAGVGSGVIKLALVGLVLGGATAGIGHLVTSPVASSRSGGEEPSSVSARQGEAPHSDAPSELPRGNEEKTTGAAEVAPNGASGAAPGLARSKPEPAPDEVDVPAPEVSPGSSVARFGESQPTQGSLAAARASQLADERAALAAARQALQGGNPQRALQLLTQLSQRFPRLTLSQEHEALSIRALAASGSRAQAEARAKRFVELYPNSPLTPGVQEILR